MIDLSKSRFLGALLALALAAPLACAAADDAHHPSLKLTPGVYFCDLNRRVELRQVAEDKKSVILYWERRNYTLHAVATQTGAIRLEDKVSGLTWITITGKSMLLDTRQGKQLANDCRV
jgi:hypothetical protein